MAMALGLSTGAVHAQAPSATPGTPSPANVVNPTVDAPASAIAPSANPDPYEGFNRKSFALYLYLDRVAIRPGAVFYAHAVPHPLRTGVHNFLQNLGLPVVFFNDVAQLHPKAAGVTLGRLALNTTVGLGGVLDPATGAGLPLHANGFGDTLGRYGAPPGPYLFIPILGPSDFRDVVGGGVDGLSSPLTWVRYTGRWEVGAARTVIGGLDIRANADAQLKILFSTATDPYASIRSLFLQNRQAEISGGEVNVDALPSFGDEPSGPPNRAGTPDAPPANLGAPAPQGAAAALPSASAPTTDAQAEQPDVQPAAPPSAPH